MIVRGAHLGGNYSSSFENSIWICDQGIGSSTHCCPTAYRVSLKLISQVTYTITLSHLTSTKSTSSPAPILPRRHKPPFSPHPSPKNHILSSPGRTSIHITLSPFPPVPSPTPSLYEQKIAQDLVTTVITNDRSRRIKNA